jgi:hypothetical protein
MKFTEPNILKISNVDFNPQNQYFFKQMANSFFGKFLQKSNKSQTVFVRTQNQLEELLIPDYKKVKSIFPFHDFCQVEVEKNLTKLPPNRNYNCYIGGQITAYAREVIYNHMTTIEQSGGTLYYVDCDSIIFTLPQENVLPVPISDAVGDFKFETHGEISSFYSFGPKSYTIAYNTTKQNVSTKVKGLSLKAAEFQHELSNEMFCSYLLSDKVEKKEILQLRNRRQPNGSYKKEFETFTFQNHFSKKRVVDKFKFTSYPYGWFQ